MKKIIVAISAFTMAFALCSCGRSADSEPAATQPSEVTTAATTAETAAVTTVPQSMTTTTAESETTTPETTTTAEVTTTSDSTTTTAAEKQTTTAEKKTTTAKQTTAAPKNTTAAKQTAVPKQTTAASKQTSAPKQTTTARQTTTAKKTTTTPKQTAAPKRTTTAPKQTAAAKKTTTTEKEENLAAIFLIDYKAMRKKGQEFRNMSDYDKAVAVVQTAYDLGGETCIQYALNTYYLAEGAGLECYLVRSSDLDWYGHVANVAKIDGEYYYLEPQGNIVGAPHTFESHKELYANSLDKITDVYDNIISVTVADHWYNEEDGDGLIW